MKVLLKHVKYNRSSIRSGFRILLLSEVRKFNKKQYLYHCITLLQLLNKKTTFNYIEIGFYNYESKTKTHTITHYSKMFIEG